MVDYETIEYYHDQAKDFAAEVHHCHNRINILELQLNEKRREATSERLHVQALKNDLSSTKSAWRRDIERLRKTSIPTGDREEGYWCRECGKELTDDFAYCPDCGVRLDWDAWPRGDDEWALDRLMEERAADKIGVM